MTNRRNRTLTPAIPFIFLSDTVGGQVFSPAGEFHTWDTVAFKTSDFHYTADDDRIIVNRQGGGYYEISFEVSWVTQEDIEELWTDIYINGTELINSHAHTYVSGMDRVSFRSQHVIHYIVYLNYKDYIQVKSQTGLIDVNTDPKSSRISIKFIAVHGWNNDSGGAINFRGGVDR